MTHTNGNTPSYTEIMARGISCSDRGYSLFVTGYTGYDYNIDKYLLTSPWDLASASYYEGSNESLKKIADYLAERDEKIRLSRLRLSRLRTKVLTFVNSVMIMLISYLLFLIAFQLWSY